MRNIIGGSYTCWDRVWDQAADGKIVDKNFGARVFELCRNIHGLRSRFAVDVKGLFHVWRYTIEYRARLHCDIHVGDVADLRRAVRFCEDGFAEVPSNLLLVNFEGGDEGNVLVLVGSETRMHEPGC